MVATVIQKYVDDMKNNIGLHFKYRSGINRHRYPNKMRFFDCYSVRDYKSSVPSKTEYFYPNNYNMNLDPQD